MVKRRVHALENLQTQYGTLERRYREELAELERKYEALYAPLYAQRGAVVRGEHEPSDEEAAGFAEQPDAMPSDARGVPMFWYHALNNSDMLVQLTGLNDRDREALGYLVDISAETLPRVRATVPAASSSSEDAAKVEQQQQQQQEQAADDKSKSKTQKEVVRTGFRLTFTFLENPFFSDRVLTKTYHIVEDEDGSPMFDRAETFVSPFPPICSLSSFPLGRLGDDNTQSPSFT